MKDNLKRIAAQSFATLRQSIQNCPDAVWRDGLTDYLTPCRLAFHSLQAMEAALWPSPDEYDWDMHGINWGGTPVGEMWGAERTLEYLDDVLARLVEFVDTHDMSAPDSQPMYFINTADRPMKVLRHLAHHTGELHAVLKVKGVPVGKFI